MTVTHDDFHSLAGRHILVVEDERLIALHVADLLRDRGCHVLGPVGSVATALGLLETVVPDVAVLDIDLQGETSEPVAAALERAGCPFVLLTALRARDLPSSLTSAPILAKPVDERKLLQTLVALLAADPQGGRRSTA